jgi:hypothetical protein
MCRNGILPALILTFSPRRRNSDYALLVLRKAIQQIQSCCFSKMRRTVLPLLEERAGVRTDVETKSYPLGF